MKKGFTLVELSIVLVIIGLLIGGILVAQSMNSTGRIIRTVSDLQQYQVAIQNFKTTYKIYPGDDPFFSPPGNVDDILGYGAAGLTPCTGITSNEESFQTFYHLSQANMIKGNYMVYQPVGCGGPHQFYYDNSNVGKFAPYTELDAKASKLYFLGKYPVEVSKASNLNYYLTMHVNADYMLPIEAKLGSNTIVGMGDGLVNTNGIGMCSAGPWPTPAVSCNDPTAKGAYFYYFMPPT